MAATNVFKALIKLGAILADAASTKTDDGKFDFISFARSSAPQDIQDAIKDLMSTLKPDEIEQAISDIQEKQKSLLAGRPLTELATDELVQYAALADAKLLLSTARLKRALEGDFFDWLVDDGLEDIVKLISVVLPLLV
jgi:Skp family chaperone for outer membrane proteins